MLEPLEWDEEESRTQETVLPSPLRASRRSRPSAGGLRVISSRPEEDHAPNTEREIAPATITSPPTPGDDSFHPEPPPVIDVIEADEEVTIPADGADDLSLDALRAMSQGVWPVLEPPPEDTITQLRSSSPPPPHLDSDAPPSAIRSVAPPPTSLPLPLVGPPAQPRSTYPPAPSHLPTQPLSHSLEATLLANEVVRLRRGLLVALVVASAALTLSLILAALMVWQLDGPADPTQPSHAPVRRSGPQLL